MERVGQLGQGHRTRNHWESVGHPGTSRSEWIMDKADNWMADRRRRRRGGEVDSGKAVHIREGGKWWL